MSSSSSAGVYVKEIDLSPRAVGPATSIGVIVGPSHRGPVNQRTLITSDRSFRETFGIPDASLTFMHHCALAFLVEASRLYVTRVANGALIGGLRCRSVVVGSIVELVPFTEGYADPVQDTPLTDADLFIVYGKDPGQWNNEIRVTVYPNTTLNDGSFWVDVFVGSSSVAVEHHNVQLTLKIDGFGVQRYIENYINIRSKYIQVKINENNPDLLAAPNRSYVQSVASALMAGGSDGLPVTESDIINGWQLYTDREQVDINILINAGYSTPAVQRAMDEICQTRRDCVAILDTPSDKQDLAGALDYRRNILNLDSSYSGLYSPDLFVLDEHSDVRLYVPPSGHVAAAYALTDNDYETWFAPAGMNRGKLDVLGVRYVYDLGSRDALAENQVNATRVFPGAGIRLWAADTLQAEASSLSNMSVRRLMCYIETALADAAIFSVFDPNDSYLRSQLIEICDRFLRPIRNARGLYSYGIQCDSDNNPPEVTANGDLMLDVYVDPVLPAKRIHLTAIVNKTGSTVTAKA